MSASSSFPRIRVLVVDDNPADRELVLEYLGDGRQDVEIVQASTLADALEILRTRPIDCVLVDLQLPDGSGLSLVDAVANLDVGDVGVVVVSGSRATRQAIEAVRLGAFDYIRKQDLNEHTLAMAVRGAISRAEVVRQQRAVTQARTHNEALFRAFIESIPHLAFAATRAGEIEFCNERWRHATGSAEGLWFAAIPDPSRDRVIEQWRVAQQADRPFEAEHPMLEPNGRVQRYLSRVVPMRDQDGMTISWVGTMTNVEELILTREALERLNDRKDRFLAVLGHEVRDPLQAMATAMLVLESAPDHLSRVLPSLGRQLKRLQSLGDDLMDASRASRGLILLHRCPVRLRECLQTATEGVTELLTTQNQRLYVDVGDVWVHGDAQRLAQIFSNLVRNAAAHGRRHGNVWVSEKSTETEVVVVVADDGPGIEPELLPHLYDPFTQGRSDHSGGLGLGLMLVHQLVTLHGGRVEGQNRRLGGAEFTVHLPRAWAPEPE